ncbi:MAG: hypothetical protein A4E56_02647 [Pelotomaculum sp. PtaU1.Bin065]|nr:MAG: hypothetical protein A4E56_02647 [Pelotomaculum sp. PtaU1.Bin065]
MICPICNGEFDAIGLDEGAREAARREWIAECSQEWLEIGRELKNKRQILGIAAKKVANAIGISSSTLKKFEDGRPVRAGRIVENAYRMYLELAG